MARERAILRLDSGREMRVEVISELLDGAELIVRLAADDRSSGSGRDLVAAVDAHLAVAARHPAGTTDRLLSADRDRLY